MKKRILITTAILGIAFTIGLGGCRKKAPAESNPASSEAWPEQIEAVTEPQSETESKQTAASETETEPEQSSADREANVPLDNTPSIEPETVDSSEKRELTAAELAEFTELIQEIENNGFLLSSYAQPEAVDLNMVFINAAGLAGYNLEAKEKAAYEKIAGAAMTDIASLTAAQIDEFLHQKMGIGFADVTKAFNWTYLSEYDTYYTELSGVYAAEFTCMSGSIAGGKVYLQLEDHSGGKSQMAYLTLQKQGDDYLFIANELIEGIE